MQRPNSDEQFPERVDLCTPWTKTQFQGNVLTCTRVALSNFLECLAQNAGIDVQFSPRFLWYYSDKAHLSIESAVETVNRVGICEDKYHPYIVDKTFPFEAHGLDDMPNLEALKSAYVNKWDIQVERISGKWDCMRALATGSPLMIISVGGNTEHARCVMGYDVDLGLEILDSDIKGEPYYIPWDSLGLVVTQVYRCVKCPWPMKVHHEYKPPTPATFADGVLTCPFIANVPLDWEERWTWFEDVKAHFAGDIPAHALQLNDTNIVGMDAKWKPHYKRLELPQVLFAGTVYENVSVTGVDIKIVEGAETNE